LAANPTSSGTPDRVHLSDVSGVKGPTSAGGKPQTIGHMAVLPGGERCRRHARAHGGHWGGVSINCPCVTGGCLGRIHTILREDEHREELLVECPSCGASFWAPLATQATHRDGAGLGRALQ
jgi:hypothetical protein